MLQCVLLDMDGTLLDTEQVSILAWQSAGRSLGIEIPRDFITGYFGMNRPAIDRLYRDTYGPEFPTAELRARRTRIGDALLQERGIRPMPGARQLLEHLKALSIPAILATGTEYPKARAEMEEAGLWPYISGSICGSMVTNCKPHPEIFLRGMALVGARPQDTLVAEDSENGARAGIAAGCKTVFIPDTRQPGPDLLPRLYACCGSLLDLIPIVDALRKEP